MTIQFLPAYAVCDPAILHRERQQTVRWTAALPRRVDPSGRGTPLFTVISNFPERVATSLSATFPELGGIDTVTPLANGYHSLVVETPQGDVFKIAKNWEGGAGYTKEYKLLPLIRDRLPVSVPYPVWYAGPSIHFPFGVIGFLKITGKVMSSTEDVHSSTARDLAAFMLALHQTDLSGAMSGVVPNARASWGDIEILRDTLTPMLRDEFQSSDYAIIGRWWSSFLNDQRMHHYEPVLIHGDLWHENLLVDPASKSLCGVLDFEHAACGDPAQDIATVLHLGRPFALEVIHEYRAAGGILDEAALYRAQRLWELREFIAAGFAIRHDNQHKFDKAVLKLRNGPLFNDATRRETSLWPPPQQ